MLREARNWFALRTTYEDVPPTSPRVHEHNFRMALRTSVPEVNVQARLAVTWQGGSDRDREISDVRRFVGTIAGQVAARDSATRLETMQNDLNNYFATARTIPNTNLVLLQASVNLEATPEALQFTQEWEQIQRQIVLDRLRRSAELEHLTYLREEIFSDPAVARSYWMKHHPTSLNELLDDRFERIAERLGQSPANVPEATVSRLIGLFLADLDSSERQYLLAQLSRVFTSFSRDDLAARLDALMAGTGMTEGSDGP
jgi:hypothetical protein